MMKPKGQTEHDTGLLEYLEDIIGTDKCGRACCRAHAALPLVVVGCCSKGLPPGKEGGFVRCCAVALLSASSGAWTARHCWARDGAHQLDAQPCPQVHPAPGGELQAVRWAGSGSSWVCLCSGRLPAPYRVPTLDARRMHVALVPACCRLHTRAAPARLEELSEKRQGMVARVKAAQKERDALAGDKAAAGAALQLLHGHAGLGRGMRHGGAQPVCKASGVLASAPCLPGNLELL